MDTQFDTRMMARALQLARRGQYSAMPNPHVGCVLVREGHVIGEGFTRPVGGNHAEVEALRAAGDATGATAYVTLEPCSHQGKTGPCAAALVRARVARVVIAMSDPNPLVAGRGMEVLRAAGITVDCGLLESEARRVIPGFISRMTRGRGRVRAKLAMSQLSLYRAIGRPCVSPLPRGSGASFLIKRILPETLGALSGG